MMRPIEEYESVQELRVDPGDPSSLVERAVGEFLQKGKRTCDRDKIYLPADFCYAWATQPENQNALFLIPDVAAQDYEVSEVEQAMERLEDYEIPQNRQELEMEQVQDYEREHQMTEGLEDSRMPQQQI